MRIQGPIASIEAFHLALLRSLEAKLDRSVFVVKGGVNLRAWLGSHRCSEDLDIDVLCAEPHLLREKVDLTLASPILSALLRTQHLAISRISKPKQTDTTQRWKIELGSAITTEPLHTKVEFSRRSDVDEFVLEPVLPEVIRPYGIPAPTLNHYTAAAAVRQKIRALGMRREVQARDIWDLDHLFRTTRVDPRPLPAATLALLDQAIDRAVGMPFDSYRSQVVSFLSPEHQDLYGTPEAWDRMRELVMERLSELKP